MLQEQLTGLVNQMVKLAVKGLYKILLIVFLFCTACLQAQIQHIWVVGDGEKIFRTGLDASQKKLNAVWNGKTIQLKGLYNEVVSFQVVLEVDTIGAKQVTIEMRPFVQQNGHQAFGGGNSAYSEDGSVELFAEQYLLVTDSTHPNWYYGSPKAMPQKMTGWIPDALVPMTALKNAQKYPINIPSLQEIDPHHRFLDAKPTQTFWVDVYLPRNMHTIPSGYYNSEVVIRENGIQVKTIPVNLELLPVYLPDTNAHTIWLYTENVYRYFPSLTHEQIDKMVKFEGHKHRIDVMGGFTVNKTPFNASNMLAYLPFLNGTAFTPKNDYQGPGIGVGEKIFPIGMYGDDPVMGNDSITVQQQANLWVNWFQHYAPSVKYFWYVTDEPQPDQYQWIKKRAQCLGITPLRGV